MKRFIIYTLAAIILGSCQKETEFSLDGDLPPVPAFTVEEVPGDPNRFVVTDLSEGSFTRLWEFTDGAPKTSKLSSDTVMYTKMGTYEIRLHVSAADGNGTSTDKKQVVVTQDAAGCPFPMLNEDCTSKCWSLSTEPASVMVGPSPFSGEWYTSPDITSSQADDQWCFYEDGTMEYSNGGVTFSACQGFVDDDNYPIASELTYSYEEGEGYDGTDLLNIEDIFVGIEDSGPTYSIVQISETTMVLLAPNKPCDGSPATGWFTLTFKSVN